MTVKIGKLIWKKNSLLNEVQQTQHAFQLFSCVACNNLDKEISAMIEEKQQQQDQSIESDEDNVNVPSFVYTCNEDDGSITILSRPPLFAGTTNVPEKSTMDLVTISLSSGEVQLFETLEAAAPPYVELRVAGGWVRDKILSRHSKDVDIALSHLSGVEFATILQSQHPGLKVGVIPANPDQSKHLETATVRLHGFDVDFCPLRGQELYSDQSRIPNTVQTEEATPLQDALRRDFTINSLFYNIRTRQVQDYTRRGIHDLLSPKNRTLVTPIDPLVTFQEDPLRVLRAIRFSIRYDIPLHNKLREAAMTDKVQKALLTKVSRERVGKELEKMLNDSEDGGRRSLKLVSELNLARCIFPFPIASTSVQGNICVHEEKKGMEHEMLLDATKSVEATDILWKAAEESLEFLPRVLNMYRALVADREAQISSANVTEGGNASTACFSVPDARLLNLATFLLPFRHLSYKDSKNKVHTVVTYMMKESIKFKNKDVMAMSTLMENLDGLLHIFKKINNTTTPHNNSSNTPSFLCRVETGLWMRNVKELWVTCWLLTTVLNMHASSSVMGDNENDLNHALQLAKLFYQEVVQSQNLGGCWNVKPLLDGRDIVQLLNIKGPIVGMYLESQVKWMLMNPMGTREGCKQFLIQQKKKEEMDSNNNNEKECPNHVSKKVCTNK